MKLSNTQLVLSVVIILALLFIFSGCSLKCNYSEGFYDQTRESQSTPFLPDECAGDEGCNLLDSRYPSGYHKAMPLSDRGNVPGVFGQLEDVDGSVYFGSSNQPPQYDGCPPGECSSHA